MTTGVLAATAAGASVWEFFLAAPVLGLFGIAAGPVDVLAGAGSVLLVLVFVGLALVLPHFWYRRLEHERDWMADDLQKAQARAELAETAKAEIVAAVNHELRAPANAVIGYSDMMLGGLVNLSSRERMGYYLGVIRQAGATLMGLIDQMVDVETYIKGDIYLNWDVVRLSDLVRGSIHDYEATARDAGATLDRLPVDRSITFGGDFDKLSQALGHLVANALAFAGAGGHVIVEAGIDSEQAVWVSVSDSGPGIAEDELHRITEAYYQGRATGSDGAGLGLAVAAGIMRAHGGRLNLSSKVGAGTTATLLLPHAAEIRRAAAAAATGLLAS